MVRTVAISRELTERLDERFEDDFSHADEQHAAEWTSRGWWRRLKERCCRVIEDEL